MPEDKQGFTLIEVVITLAVFTIGIVASFSLAIANLNSARNNFDRILATNLAREGIELIRGVRDSNWLRADNNEICGSAPNEHICNWDDGLDYDFVYMDYSNSTPLVFGVCVGISMDACFLNCESSGECELFVDSNNFFVHDPTNAAPTGKYRLIQINAICQNDLTGVERTITGSSDCDALTETKIGIEVTSRVKIGQGGGNKEHVDLVETLYNWRR